MALGRRKCQEMKVHFFLMISDFRKICNNFIGKFPDSARFSYVKSSTENDDEVGKWWKINRRESRSIRRKTTAARNPLPQIQHGLTYARTRADAVKGRRLSTSDSQIPKLT